MQKILVPFDGSAAAMHAVQFVVDSFDAAVPVQVHVLNVQDNPSDFYSYIDAAAVREVERELSVKGRKILLQAAEVLQRGAVPHQLHVHIGLVAETIAQQAEALGCNSVVMGKRGLGALSGLLLGSVANKVIHIVHVPVTIVK